MPKLTAARVSAGCATVVAVAAAAILVADRAGASRDEAPPFDHVVLIVFENKSAPQLLAARGAGTFRRLGERYALLARYDAVAHPSLPNYLALVSGSTFGLVHDCLHCVVRGPSLADTLAAHGLSWKAYVEDLPARASAIRRHTVKARIPFVYFHDVLDDPARMRSIVPLSTFAHDLRAGTLPSFSLVVPSLCHDMHSCSIRAGSTWLASFVHPLLRARRLRDGVVFVLFDEGRRHDLAGGGGHVAALVLGSLVRPDSVSLAPLSHYSVLRTIEDDWHLPRLGQSQDAPAIDGIWRRR